MNKEIILDKIFFDAFIEWLEFDLNSQQYNIKYKNDLIELWSICFLPGLSLNQVFERLQKLSDLSRNSTFQVWGKSLRFHFFYFVLSYYSELTIYGLCKSNNFNLKDLVFDLRLFVRNQLEFKQHDIDLFFLNNLAVESNWNIGHSSLTDSFNKKNVFKSQIRDNKLILTKNLSNILNEMKNVFAPNVSFDYLNKFDNFFKSGFRYFLEGIALVVVFYVGTLLINKSNFYWETLLAKKIKIFEPQSKWLKTGLAFNRDKINHQTPKTLRPRAFSVLIKDLNSMVKSKFNNWNQTESETVLSSLDIIPKNIDESDYELSAYEETKKRGYRDSHYGSTKVYRVVINSPVSRVLGNKLKNILNFYNTAKVDNVEPGQKVPGGNYYNIFVPRKFLKEFLTRIMDLGESFLYESKTRTLRNPPGQNKVFIWIKNI